MKLTPKGFAVILDLVLAHTGHLVASRMYPYEQSPWYGDILVSRISSDFPVYDYTKKSYTGICSGCPNILAPRIYMDGFAMIISGE
jgi:hypothetical protein